MNNNIKVRQVTMEDYKQIDSWYKKRKELRPKITILPGNGLGGFIVEKNGEPIAVIYLYLTNSNMGYIDNLISDPSYISKDRFIIIIELIAACKQMALDVGCTDIWAISNSKGIIKRCEKLQYNISKNNYAIISI